MPHQHPADEILVLRDRLKSTSAELTKALASVAEWQQRAEMEKARADAAERTARTAWTLAAR